MNNGFECTGFWWLPESPDLRVPGLMSFSPGEPLKLELMGSLVAEESDLFGHEFINPLIIQGTSSDGKRISLADCLQTARTGNLSSTSVTTSFTAQLAYIGVHFPNTEQAKFNRISVGFHGLDEWFNTRAFNFEHPDNESLIAKYTRPKWPRVYVGDILIEFVSLGPRTSYNPNTFINISQEALISITPKSERTIDEFFPIIRLIQDFLTLAMSKPTFIIETTGDSELAKFGPPDQRYSTPIEIYYSPVGWREEVSTMGWYDMLFTLPLVEAELSIILNNWFEKANFVKPVYDLYFAPLYNPSMYSESHFLSLAQAIETYHRQIYGGKYQEDEQYLKGLYEKLTAAISSEVAADFKSSLISGKLRYANEYSLRKRLRLLVDHISENLHIDFLNESKQREVFAEKVADTRNYLTHYSPELKDRAATSGQELHHLSEELRLVMQICFLEMLGFSFDRITELMKRHRNYRQYFS